MCRLQISHRQSREKKDKMNWNVLVLCDLYFVFGRVDEIDEKCRSWIFAGKWRQMKWLHYICNNRIYEMCVCVLCNHEGIIRSINSYSELGFLLENSNTFHIDHQWENYDKSVMKAVSESKTKQWCIDTGKKPLRLVIFERI